MDNNGTGVRTVTPSLHDVARSVLDDLDGTSKEAFVGMLGAGAQDPMAAGAGGPPVDPMAAGAGGGMPPPGMEAGMPPPGMEAGMPPPGMEGGMPPEGGEAPPGPDMQTMLIEALRSALPQVLQEMGVDTGKGKKPKKEEMMYSVYQRLEQLANILQLPPLPPMDGEGGQQAAAPAQGAEAPPMEGAPPESTGGPSGAEAAPPMLGAGPLDPQAGPLMAGVKTGEASGIADIDDNVGRKLGALVNHLRSKE